MRAILLGGTGAIGFATARRLLGAGWSVDITGRDPTHVPPALLSAGARFFSFDRDDAEAVRALLSSGADLLLDCACYTGAQAAALVPLLPAIASAVMISSKAVYVDANGRHSNSNQAPQFDGPIRESQPTMPPSNAPFDSREGYGANKVAAESVLLETGHPVTVLRPSKVHGAWSRRPREWVFVRRVLDHRGVVVLRHEGASVDHPSAAANIAALVETVASKPAPRILNIADPDAPDVLEISRIVARHLGHTWREVLLADAGEDEWLGRTPWDAVPRIVLDTSAAIELGYRPAGDYATTVAEELDWLVASARDPAAAWVVPDADDPFFAPLLDYALEDRYLGVDASEFDTLRRRHYRGRD